jgi:hypothetical protein
MTPTTPVIGFNCTFWGIAALIFGGFALAGLGRDYVFLVYGLIGGGALLVFTGLGQWVTSGRAGYAPGASVERPTSGESEA